MKFIKKWKTTELRSKILEQDIIIHNLQTKIDQLSNVLDSIPGSVYWKDLEGRYLGCNHFQKEMNGDLDMIGLTDNELPWYEIAEEIAHNDKTVISTKTALEVEEHPTLRNGSKISMLSRKAPLYDERKNIIGIIGVSLDISNRKKDIQNLIYEKDTLKKEKDLIELTLSNIVAEMPGHVYWKNKEGVYLGCNDRQAKSLGLCFGKDVIGKTDFDLPWGANIAHTFRENDLLVINTGRPISIEEKTVVDGIEGTVLSQKTPLKNSEGIIIGVLGISVDITELKKTQQELLIAKEAAEAASRAKTEFVQNMQHDIRTPSAGIWGLLDSLSKSEKDPERQKVLKMATESSKRLLDLCNDAVEFGDLEGHAKPVVEQKIDPREIARSVVELNLPAIFAKNLSLHFAVDASVPPYIKSDPFRLSRILINLLGNSVKFTEKGGISLTLKATKETAHRKGMLVIELKDTGIGISKDKITHVFEKFSRAVASNTNKYPGSGLGLYVVKIFLDELDGDIELESHEGEGSCFTIIIPFKTFLLDEGELGEIIDEQYHSPLKKEPPKIATLPQIEDNKDREEKSSKATFNHKILIVEDDSVCLFAEKQLVSTFTNNIDTAKNMHEALACLAQKHYDLVICDLGLPDGSGAEIAATIRNSPESPNHKVPFIAMTAHRDKEKHEEALKAGFTEVAMKPLIEDRMLQFLQSYPVEGEEIDDDLEVIDLELTIKRLHAKNVKGALMGLEILSNSLKEDIPLLQQAEKQNDILGAREVLHKIRGGLYYSGTPRLEKAVAQLHAAVKSVQDLKEIADKFSFVYEEVKEFEEYYQAIITA